MKIYCLQMDIAWEDRSANHEKVRRLLDRARPEKGSLIALPEMFASGFSMNVEAVKDTGETERFLKAIAKEYSACVLAGVVSVDAKGRGRNDAVVITPQGELARYQKMHPFTLGGESNCYARGEGVVLFDWAGLKVAPLICYDLRFPEPFRCGVRRGAEVFIVIASWPIAREHHWVKLLEARAIENQAYVVGVNRVGRDPNLLYPGRTLVVDPHGYIIADAANREGVLTAELDGELVRDWRRNFPVLSDMHEKYP